MLTSISTNFSILPTELISDFIINESIIYDNEITFDLSQYLLAADVIVNDSVIYDESIGLHGVLLPIEVINLSVMHSNTIFNLGEKQLAPDQIVNTSIIYDQSIAVNVVTSYANSGGTGNRLSLITSQILRSGSIVPLAGGSENNLVDGDLGANNTDGCDLATGIADYSFAFDFRPTGFFQIIDEMTFRFSNTNTHGTYLLEGWDGDGWTTLVASFTLGGSTTQVLPITNTAGYCIYRMRQLTGVSAAGHFIEAEFKLAQGAALPTSTTSYANAGGTGNRNASITITTTITLASGVITALLNGVTSDAAANLLFNGGQTLREIKIDLGSGNNKVIDEWRYYTGNNANHGNWYFSGSDNDSTYDDLGIAFQLNGNNFTTAQVFTHSARNTHAYRYYKWRQVNGAISGGVQQGELEFKIS